MCGTYYIPTSSENYDLGNWTPLGKKYLSAIRSSFENFFSPSLQRTSLRIQQTELSKLFNIIALHEQYYNNIILLMDTLDMCSMFVSNLPHTWRTFQYNWPHSYEIYSVTW